MYLTMLAVAAGVFTFMQTTINARLRAHVQSPYLSSLISFTIGTLLLGGITLIGGGSLLPSASQIAAIPWWVYLGGFLGMIVMTAYILLFPIIGGVQTVALPILGQIIMSMLIDNLGWFNVEKQSLNGWNAAGIVVLTAGVLMVVLLPDYLNRKKNNQSQGTVSGKLAWQFLAIGAGMLLGMQIAINGQLGAMLHSPTQSAFISLGIGAIILLLINIFQKTWKNVSGFCHKKAPWWIWIGGISGAVYIYLSTYLAPKIGTGSVVVFALLGQMTSSLCVDHFGLLGAAKRKVSVIQISGLLVMLLGVAAIKFIIW